MALKHQDSADLFGADHRAEEPPEAVAAPLPPEKPTIRFSPCRYCNVTILRVVEDRGNPMMVEPCDHGPYVVDGVGPLKRPLVRVVSSSNDVLRRGVVAIRKVARGEARYQSHFATCPQRERWGKTVVTDPLHAAALAAEPGR